MTTWPAIPGPWGRPADGTVIGTLGPDDIGRPGDEVTLGAQPPLLDLRGREVRTRRTVVDNPSNPGLVVRPWSERWLLWRYSWREVLVPVMPLTDPTGDGRGWVLTDEGAYEYQGDRSNDFPQILNPWIVNRTRTNVGYYRWGVEWTPLPAGTVGTTTGGLPDIALFQMERGQPIDHALHIGLPADLLRLPTPDTLMVRGDDAKLFPADFGYVAPASFTDIHPEGHPQYRPDRGRRDGTPGVPMGARLRLTGSTSVTVTRSGTDGSNVVEPCRVIDALRRFGGYVTTTAQPTSHPAGRIAIGLTDDYLTRDERRALTAALQGATWEVVVDG